MMGRGQVPVAFRCSREAAGVTLLEMVMVITIITVTLTIATRSYRSYADREAVRSASLLFQRDLTLARTSALRTRESVVLRLDREERRYVVSTSGGEELVQRNYGSGAPAPLDLLELSLPGDSVLFRPDGLALIQLSGDGVGAEGHFARGATRYVVSFNAVGHSTVDRGS